MEFIVKYERSDLFESTTIGRVENGWESFTAIKKGQEDLEGSVFDLYGNEHRILEYPGLGKGIKAFYPDDEEIYQTAQEVYAFCWVADTYLIGQDLQKLLVAKKLGSLASWIVEGKCPFISEETYSPSGFKFTCYSFVSKQIKFTNKGILVPTLVVKPEISSNAGRKVGNTHIDAEVLMSGITASDLYTKLWEIRRDSKAQFLTRLSEPTPRDGYLDVASNFLVGTTGGMVSLNAWENDPEVKGFKFMAKQIGLSSDSNSQVRKIKSLPTQFIQV